MTVRQSNTLVMILGKKVSPSSVLEGAARQPTMTPLVIEKMVKQSNLLGMIRLSKTLVMTQGKKVSKSSVLEGADRQPKSEVTVEPSTMWLWKSMTLGKDRRKT